MAENFIHNTLTVEKPNVVFKHDKLPPIEVVTTKAYFQFKAVSKAFFQFAAVERITDNPAYFQFKSIPYNKFAPNLVSLDFSLI